MDYRDLTALLVKIAGAVLLINVFLVLPDYVTGAFRQYSSSFPTALFAAIFPLLFPLIGGLFLLVFPRTIVNQLVRGEPLSSQSPEFLRQIEQIALSILGFYVLFRATSDLVAQLARIFWLRHVESPHMTNVPFGSWIAAEGFSILAATVIEFVVGLWFLFGAKSILTFVRKMRGME